MAGTATRGRVPVRIIGSCGVIHDSNRKHFNYMWKLVKQAGLALPFWRGVSKVFTDELLIGLFWEESTFRNRPQHGLDCVERGPAYGFGQIEPGGFGPYKALTRYKSPIDRIQQVLGNDTLSVQMTMRMLYYLYAENPGKRNKRAALYAYGTAFGSPSRQKKIKGWTDCEKILWRGKRTWRNPDGYWLPPRSEIEEALLAAKPNSEAFLPEVLEGIP